MPFRDDLKAAQQRVEALDAKLEELQAELREVRAREREQGPERAELESRIRDLEARLAEATRVRGAAPPPTAPRSKARGVVVLIVFATLLAALLSWQTRRRPVPPRTSWDAPKTPACSIETNPAGARVFSTTIGDRAERQVGTTPLSLEQPVLDKTMLISMDGYELASVALPGGPLGGLPIPPSPPSCTVQVTLVPLPVPPADRSGTVHVESDPAYSTVELDGKKACVTPCALHLAADRSYAIAVQPNDSSRIQEEKTISVQAGQSVRLHVRHQTLEELLAAPASASASADAGRRPPPAKKR